MIPSATDVAALQSRLDAAEKENADLESALDEADKRAKECEAEGDMFGWNFFKGQRSGTVNRSISQQATVRSIRAALAPDSGADCGTAEPAMLKELRAHVSTLTITSENIGDIRRSLFMPFDCDWNGWVRGLTAERENKDCGTKEEGETR